MLSYHAFAEYDLARADEVAPFPVRYWGSHFPAKGWPAR